VAAVTLRTDLDALLAGAGIDDANIDQAIEDEHVRSLLYRKVVAIAVASQSRASDRTIVATILRDPVDLVSKSAVVEFMDAIAMKTADPAVFRQWAAGLRAETAQLAADATHTFISRRIDDWNVYLSIGAGRIPTSGELASTTHWMQRLLAERSTSPPVLALLADIGRTRKIRNIARHRAASRAVRENSRPPV
jgi:hypothetical protein